jgi:glucosylceramidase
MNRMVGRNYARSLQTVVLAALTAGSLTLFGSPLAHAAVLSVGPTSGPFGGYVCADVAGGSLAAGTPVQDYDCNGAPNQQFEWGSTQIMDYGMPIYVLGGQRCLSAPANFNYVLPAPPGTLVESDVCDGSPYQAWTYQNGAIQLGRGNGDCLDATNSTNGTQLVINRCNGAPSQNWLIK